MRDHKENPEIVDKIEKIFNTCMAEGIKNRLKLMMFKIKNPQLYSLFK